MQLAVVLGAATLTTSAAHAADAAPTPPAAVLAALQPGASTFEQAARLGAANENGEIDETRASVLVKGASFGEPHEYAYYWEPTSKLSSAATFTDADLSLDRGRRWLSVERQDGVPFSMVELDDRGSLDAVGGWTDGELLRIDALPAGALVVTDGRFGEAFSVSADRRAVSALNPAAETLLGSREVGAPTFRSLKATEAAARSAELRGAGPDSSGGGASVATATRQDGVVVTAAAAVVLIGLVAAATAAARRQASRARRARERLRTSAA